MVKNIESKTYGCVHFVEEVLRFTRPNLYQPPPPPPVHHGPPHANPLQLPPPLNN